MKRQAGSDVYPAEGYLVAETSYSEGLVAEDLADVLRSAMREEYADASDEEMGDAIEAMLDAMSPAEGFNFASALKSARQLTSDPTFIQVVRTAAPIAGGALGTVIGGPVGAALGSQLGNIAASALAPAPSPPPAPPPSAVATPIPSPAAGPSPVITPSAAVTPIVAPPASSAAAAPPDISSPPGPASSVAGGSAAAAQGLVLTQQSDVLQALLSAALGRHGRPYVRGGVPIAQVLALLSQIFGQAAADADELMYLEQQTDAMESVNEAAYTDSAGSLYADLLGADNHEFADAAGWEGLD